MKVVQYLNEGGELAPIFKGKIPNDLLINGYKAMVKTRYVDERMITLQRQGTITFAMSGLGEEACAVASAAALDIEDWMYPQYREAGVLFWRGFTIEQYLHQMFGDAKDLILGRQMPNHFGSRKLNVVTVSSPIGTKLPHAAGAAYAMRYFKEPHVTICYFGEGATSEGDFHTGLNFAAVRKVPCIFFCRNNGYAISTPVCRQFACASIASKGEGYGVTTYQIDGNDFFAIFETVQKAKAHGLEGKGPVLIEALTYRLGAHSTSDDPSLYRSDEEVHSWSAKCPIHRLRRYLENAKLWDENQDKEYRQSLVEEMNAAIEIAKNTTRPSLSSLIDHVYFETPQKLKEQLEEIKPFFHEENS